MITHNETTLCAIEAALLERLRASLENEFFQTFGIFPAGGRKVGVGFV